MKKTIFFLFLTLTSVYGSQKKFCFVEVSGHDLTPINVEFAAELYCAQELKRPLSQMRCTQIKNLSKKKFSLKTNVLYRCHFKNVV